MKFTKKEQELLNGILNSYELFFDKEDGKETEDELKAIEGLRNKLIKQI